MDDTLFWGLLPIHSWFTHRKGFLVWKPLMVSYIRRGFLCVLYSFSFRRSILSFRSSVLFMLFMFIYSSLRKESAKISVSEALLRAQRTRNSSFFFFFASSGLKITSGQRTLSGQKGDLIGKNVTSITSYRDGHVVYCCLFLNKLLFILE